jgi:hypothetical protein
LRPQELRFDHDETPLGITNTLWRGMTPGGRYGDFAGVRAAFVAGFNRLAPELRPKCAKMLFYAKVRLCPSNSERLSFLWFCRRSLLVVLPPLTYCGQVRWFIQNHESNCKDLHVDDLRRILERYPVISAENVAELIANRDSPAWRRPHVIEGWSVSDE